LSYLRLSIQHVGPALACNKQKFDTPEKLARTRDGAPTARYQ